MYVYYRATSQLEANWLNNFDELPSEAGVTYWTDGLGPARWYQGEGRKVVKIFTSKPIPQYYFGIAEGCDEKGNTNNHREWCVPKADFNVWLCANLEDVQILN